MLKTSLSMLAIFTIKIENYVRIETLMSIVVSTVENITSITHFLYDQCARAEKISISIHKHYFQRDTSYLHGSNYRLKIDLLLLGQWQSTTFTYWAVLLTIFYRHVGRHENLPFAEKLPPSTLFALENHSHAWSV